jgi:hypothetical protein
VEIDNQNQSSGLMAPAVVYNKVDYGAASMPNMEGKLPGNGTGFA